MLDLESVSSTLSGQLSSRVGPGQPLMMALDKDFLVQLENSLQRLVDSNEQVKQVAREKEQTEQHNHYLVQECIKLKGKVQKLKLENAGHA